MLHKCFKELNQNGRRDLLPEKKQVFSALGGFFLLGTELQVYSLASLEVSALADDTLGRRSYFP